MSKMDNLRAMREARYERRPTQPAKPPASQPAKPVRTARAEPQPASEQEPTEELCGHRAISGRTCTRERGHTAKSHRYA